MKKKELKTQECEIVCEELIKSPHFFYAIEWRVFKSESSRVKKKKNLKKAGKIVEFLKVNFDQNI